MVKPNKYFKDFAIGEILKKCDYNLKAVKAYIRRECELAPKYDIAYTMRLFKRHLVYRCKKTVKAELIAEIVTKMRGETL